MADAALEPDAGDQSVIDAILSTKEAPPAKGEAPPREPPVEGDTPADDPDAVPDEENPDEEPSEKEEAEGEEEKEEKAEAEDVDVDDLLVEITINGKTEEVPLKNLKQNYSGTKYIEQNIQQAVEIRKAVEYNAASLYAANQQAVEKLTQIDAVLDSMAQPQIDWEALRSRNPTEYVLKREEQREIQDKQKLVAQEIERVNAEQAALQSQSRQRLVLDQAQLLADRLPDLADPKKAPVVMDRLMRTAEHFGFQRPEIEGVLDHRQMLVLYAASEWLQERQQKSQVRQKANGDASASNTPAPKKILLRPGSSQNSAESQSKRLTVEAFNRARKTGSVEDVAKTLILSAPKRR